MSITVSVWSSESTTSPGISPAMTLQKMHWASGSATSAKLIAAGRAVGVHYAARAHARRQPALRPPRGHLVGRGRPARAPAHEHQPGAVRIHAPDPDRGARHRPAGQDGARRRLRRRPAGGGVRRPRLPRDGRGPVGRVARDGPRPRRASGLEIDYVGGTGEQLPFRTRPSTSSTAATCSSTSTTCSARSTRARAC